MPKVTIHTSLKPAYGCAICGVSVKGVTPGELGSQLFDKYKIHTTASFVKTLVVQELHLMFIPA